VIRPCGSWGSENISSMNPSDMYDSLDGRPAYSSSLPTEKWIRYRNNADKHLCSHDIWNHDSVGATEGIAHLKLRGQCHRLETFASYIFLFNVVTRASFHWINCAERSCACWGERRSAIDSYTRAAPAAELYLRLITTVNTLTCLSARVRQDFDFKRIPSSKRGKQLR
jgi:hypothetical protein